MALYETNTHALRQQESEQIEQMKYAARMAQQQDRFQPKPTVTGAPTTLNETIEMYDNMLSGLMEELEKLERKMTPILLNEAFMERVSPPATEVSGATLTIRMLHLNEVLHNATNKVRILAGCLNI